MDGLTLDVAPSPASPLADLFADALQRNLDFLLAGQQDDGGWPAAWSWGEQYPEAAEAARRDIRSIVTLRALRSLRDFRRLP